MAEGTSTATRSKGATRPAAKAAPARVDGRTRFAWLQEYRATVIYQGDECLINVGTRKQPFRGKDLTSAVNAAMADMPAGSAAGGSRTSGPRSRAAGK